MSPFTLCLLGPPHLMRGEQRFDLPVSAPSGLLACLGTQGDWVSREQLALLFWPDAGTSDAQRLLRVTLHRARALLRTAGIDDALVTERSRLRLVLPADVPQFRAAVARGDWAQALALHRAPLLAGHPLRGFSALDDWFARQREHLLADWRAAALQRAAALAERGDARQAVALLQAQLQSDLMAEDVLQALLRHAAAADERVSALATFERFCARAEAELALAPLPATAALAQALRQRVPAPPKPPVLAPSAVLRGETPLVGRSAELAGLQRLGPGLVLLTGEPGLGKTRLVQAAVAASAAAGTGPVLWLQAREDWASAPLQALCQALAPVAGIVRTLLPTLDLPVDTAAQLLHLGASGGEETGTSPAAAPAGGLLDGVAALLRAWPSGIVVDDLQWLDPVTLDALGQALADLPAPRVMATLRPASVTTGLQRWLDRLDAAGVVTTRALPPLPADAVQALVAHHTGHDAPRFAAWLAQRTGGNPFFTLECLANLAPTPPDLLPESAWAQAVPVRVSAALQRRIERLGDATQRVLTIAAAAGDAQQLELLAGLAGLSEWATAQALTEAQQAGLLNGRQFAHGLVRDLLWQRTPEALRAVLHAGLARKLADKLPPHLVAQHWWAADAPHEAVTATVAAAALDASRGLLSAAEQLLAAALARLPADATDDAARLLVKRAYIARQRPDFDAAGEYLARALAHLPLPATQQMAWGERFELALARGQLDAARTCLDQARILGPDLPSLWLDGAKLAHAQGDAAQCAALMGPYVAWLRKRPPGAELASALTGQGVAFDMLGQGTRALPLHQEALAITRRVGARHTEAEVMNNLVVCLGEMGRDDDAVRQGLALLKALAAEGQPPPSTLAVNVAYSLLHLGRLDEAEALYRGLAGSALTSVACAATGKLLVIQARRGAPDAVVGEAVEATFRAMAATEMYTVQVSAMLAVLQHGRPVDAPRVLPWLRDEPLPAGLQDRLDEALQARGLRWPSTAT